MGTALVLAVLAELVGLPFFVTCSQGFPEAERFLELPLAIVEGDASFAFALRPALCFLTMACSIASRSGRRALGD